MSYTPSQTAGSIVRIAVPSPRLPLQTARIRRGVIIAEITQPNGATVSGLVVDDNGEPLTANTSRSIQRRIGNADILTVRPPIGSLITMARDLAVLQLADSSAVEKWQREYVETRQSNQALAHRLSLAGVLVIRGPSLQGGPSFELFVPNTPRTAEMFRDLDREFETIGRNSFGRGVSSVFFSQLDPENPHTHDIAYVWMSDPSNARFAAEHLGVGTAEFEHMDGRRRAEVIRGLSTATNFELRDENRDLWIDAMKSHIQRLDTIDAVRAHPSSDPTTLRLQNGLPRSARATHPELTPVEELALVGWNKPAGYHSVYQLEQLGTQLPERLAEFARQRGNAVIYQRDTLRSRYWGGHFCVYKPEAVQSILDNHAPELLREGSPVEARAFMELVFRQDVLQATSPTSYRAIAEVFGDAREDFRTPLYAEMLKERDAFRSAGGLDVLVPPSNGVPPLDRGVAGGDAGPAFG